MNYANQTVLVLGLGESGLAMARWLAYCGAVVRVADTRELPDRLSLLQQDVPGAEFISGAFSALLLEGVHFVAISPGLAPQKELADIVSEAANKEIPVWGEIELFAQALIGLQKERDYKPKVIAITGTNGKTTVTNLIGQMCAHAGYTVRVAGNISPAALDVLHEVLEQDNLPQIWVLELSSFQLWSTHSLNPDAATILNVTQDHLDWHASMDEYVMTKNRIFGLGTVRVLNRDDDIVIRMALPNKTATSFGMNAPVHAGDFGLHTDRDMEWLSVASVLESDEKPKKKELNVVQLETKHLMPVAALQIQGRHNASNALAALALCRAIELPMAPLLHALRDYRGEPHRVELIATIGGVAYIDDSKGTNVGATVAGIEGIGSGNSKRPRRLILIAGGDGKHQDFSPLIAPVRQYVHTILLIGKDARRLQETLQNTGASILVCGSLEQAVQDAKNASSEGDVILLSPACASMDMFRNYAHRAQVFADTVREIALSGGEVML